MESVVEELVPGGRLVTVKRLTGGVSADAFRLDMATPTGEARRVVFRQHRTSGFKRSHGQRAPLEYGVLLALHRQGLAVPEPFLVYSDGAGTGSWVVLEWVDGTTQVEAADLPGALEQMAHFLAELHAVDTMSLAVPVLEPMENPFSAIGDCLPPDPAGEEVKAALDTVAPGWEPNRAVLVHGDYWPGNVIWRAGMLAAVIDWEDACLGDPLADLAAARVELACAYGIDAMEHFTASYLAATSARPLRLGALPVWEVYVSASALSTMHEWGLDQSEEDRRRRRSRRFFERAARDLVGRSVSGGPDSGR